MKKNLILFVLILSFGLILTGCSGQNEKEKSVKEGESYLEQKQSAQDKTTDNEEEESSQISISSLLARFEDVDSCKYDVISKMPNRPEQRAQIWWKGNKMRAEATVDFNGQETNGVYILDTENKESIVYSPDQNRGIKMNYSETKEKVGDSPKNQNEEIKVNNPEIVGYETWDGKDCVVVSYVTEQGAENKVWVWQEYGFPVRVVSNTDQGEYVTEMTNIEFTDIDSSKMQVPEGVQILSLPTGIMP